MRASETRAAATPRVPAKPPVPEFLADEFVEDDLDELLPEELIVEDRPSESAVIFAGPSDPPPGPAVRPPPATTSATPTPAPTVSRQRLPIRAERLLTMGCGAIVGALIVAIAVRSRAPAAVHAEPPAISLPAIEPPPQQAPAVLFPRPTQPPAPATSVSSPPPPAVATALATASVAAPSPPESDAATDAKHAAQKALEDGQVAKAITLGEQSVRLDPTDAEGWLILGAGYLQKGAFKDAHRCFISCVKQATHGALRECAALSR